VRSVGRNHVHSTRLELAALVADAEQERSLEHEAELLVLVAVLGDDAAGVELDDTERDSLPLHHAAENPIPDLLRRHGADLVERAQGPRSYTRLVSSDEYVLDTSVVRGFVSSVRAAITAASSPEEACEAIRPSFAELLADPNWLPPRYQESAPESGMGGGIGQWLLFRSGDGSLSLFSLVVPPDAQTPVHDHLAWGLVGLYRGTQDEEIYAEPNGRLELVERRALVPGDFYALLPPRDDIHRVRTTSPETSVSIHLLTNDTGCVWRHAYDPESGERRPFRSGYVNVACKED
jgi:3-mercaptopropionate dioxygenase